MNSPEVSIIIPYYNRPIKLERCLQSVYVQTFSDYEIIVVDDASGIAPLPLREDVIIIKQVQNQGPGMARNAGLRIAKGNYVVFLDSDDYWHPEFLEHVVEALNLCPQAVMSYTDGLNVDSQNRVISSRRKKTIHSTTILPNLLYSGKTWGTGSCLWRKSIIENIEYIAARNWEDYAFDVEVGLINNQIIPIEKPLVYYDVTGDDKLSKKDYSYQFKEKSKSLCHVSRLLYHSFHKEDEKINKYITILLLLNLAKQKRHNLNQLAFYKNDLRELRRWRSMLFVLLVGLFTFMSKRIAIRFLKRLKRQVNQERLPFLLK